MFFVFAGIELSIEHYSKKFSHKGFYFTVAIARFITGFYVSFGVPYILSLYFPKDAEKTSSSAKARSKVE